MDLRKKQNPKYELYALRVTKEEKEKWLEYRDLNNFDLNGYIRKVVNSYITKQNNIEKAGD